jgi:hypothetical protein
MKTGIKAGKRLAAAALALLLTLSLLPSGVALDAAYSITAPTGATVRVYGQVKNYNLSVAALLSAEDNGDGTTTFGFDEVAGATKHFRVSMPGKVTKAGYFKGTSFATAVAFGEDEAPDDGVSTAKAAQDDANTLLNIQGYHNVLNLAGVGDTYKLRAFRAAWQIIDSEVNNQMIEPDFHYNILSGGDVISVTPDADIPNWATITALSEGTAVIEVYYDAIDVGGGTTAASVAGRYGATKPTLRGLAVVTVGDKGVGGDMSVAGKAVWDSEFDIFYTLGDSDELPVSTTDGAAISAWNPGAGRAEVAAVDGKVTVYPGNNVLKSVIGGVTTYKVVRVVKLTPVFTPERPEVGDAFSVRLDGLVMAVPKMSGIYNPAFNTTKLHMDGTDADVNGGQYTFSHNTYLTGTYTGGEQTIGGGYIWSSTFGSVKGAHRGLTDTGVGVNMNAPALTAELGVLPVIRLADYFEDAGGAADNLAITFIDADTYHLPQGCKVLILEAASGAAYSFDGHAMFRSAKYPPQAENKGAFVYIVDANLTEDEARALIAPIAAGAGGAIAYNGDVNGDGEVNAADAGCVYDIYADGYADSVAALGIRANLEADVNGDGTVDVLDALLIRNIILGAGSTDGTRTFEFRLTARKSGGAAGIYVGDEITVSLTLVRTDIAAGGSYAIYAAQDEIEFDGARFELVGAPVLTREAADAGFRAGVRTLSGGNGRVYMNFVTATPGGGTQIPAVLDIGSFTLRVTSPGTSAITNGNVKMAKRLADDVFESAARDISVTAGAATPPTGGGGYAGGGNDGTISIDEGATPLAAPDAPAFDDVGAEHWAYLYVEYLAARGFVYGRTPRLFCPGDSLTRAECVAILARMSGEAVPAAYSGAFTDVPEAAYYSGAVQWAVGAGIVRGTSATTFSPGARITRQDLAVLLTRYAEHKNYAFGVVDGQRSFTDAAAVSEYARASVALLQRANVLGGYGDGSFRPGGYTTRAEMSKLFALIHGAMNRDEG